MSKRLLLLFGFLLLIVGPLAGRYGIGMPPGFSDFPPLIVDYPDHAPFSWTFFIVFAGLAAAGAFVLARPTWFGFDRGDRPPLARLAAPSEARTERLHAGLGLYPWWGWMGLVLVALSWTCAWNRFVWLGPLQDHMFVPLWLGYIFTIDGLVYRRIRRSLFRSNHLAFLCLFPASAMSWWYFEFLNRFIKNWWYVGAEEFTSVHYILSATLSFSTVLPAIFVTAQLLLTISWFRTAYARGPRWQPWARRYLMLTVMCGGVGLALMTKFNDPLFWFAWTAPMAVVAGVLGLAGLSTPFHALEQGRYTPLVALASAALVCGFFWELWNYFSMPKWEYSIPYVYRFTLFEMPIVGYAGYLAFGPLCWCLWIALRELLPERVRVRLLVAELD